MSLSGIGWKLGGRLSRIASKWDFKELTRLTSLHEAPLCRWGGFLFADADPEA